MYLVMVYYRRSSFFSEGPDSELWSSALTLREAKAVARKASREYPHDEFSVEGEEFEPGGWTNPLYRAGKKMR